MRSVRAGNEVMARVMICVCGHAFSLHKKAFALGGGSLSQRMCMVEGCYCADPRLSVNRTSPTRTSLTKARNNR